MAIDRYHNAGIGVIFKLSRISTFNAFTNPAKAKNI